MSDTFDVNDQSRAEYEGWIISQSEEHGFQIQKVDEKHTFDTDADAALFVTDMAFEYRSNYHRSAIEFLMEHGGHPE